MYVCVPQTQRELIEIQFKKRKLVCIRACVCVCVCNSKAHTMAAPGGMPKFIYECETSFQQAHTLTLRMCRPAVDMQIVHTHTHTRRLKLLEICCVSNTLSKCKVRLHRILTIRRLNASRSMQQPLSVECRVCRVCATDQRISHIPVTDVYA